MSGLQQGTCRGGGGGVHRRESLVVWGLGATIAQRGMTYQHRLRLQFWKGERQV